MRQNLHPGKLQVSLDTFVQRMNLLNRADNPELLTKIVMRWTKGQPLLTKKLLQYVLQSESRIREGEEAISVEKVIRNRLLKEFKKDDLTLNIRRSLYKKDLDNLLEVTNGQLNDNDQLYLLRIQKSLGLSYQECQVVNSEKLGLNSYFSLHQKNNIISQDKNYKLSTAEEYNLISLESRSICEESDLTTQTAVQPAIAHQPKRSFQQKWLWLLLWTPFLFLSLKGIDWLIKHQITVEDDSNAEQQLCIDLTNRESPRMSLGEKLLTKEYNQPISASMIASYEGMAAFARCEFSAAQAKYQQSLGINKNNPEASIYYHNAEAIAQQHLKIAVSVPLGSKPDIAWEILRGVAQSTGRN